jgi:hypothetical protein
MHSQRDPESQIPNPESQVPNPESRIPNPESRIPNPESRIPSTSPQTIAVSFIKIPVEFLLYFDILPAADFEDPSIMLEQPQPYALSLNSTVACGDTLCSVQ